MGLGFRVWGLGFGGFGVSAFRVSGSAGFSQGVMKTLKSLRGNCYCKGE